MTARKDHLLLVNLPDVGAKGDVLPVRIGINDKGEIRPGGFRMTR
jgi:hypothetical protein